MGTIGLEYLLIFFVLALAITPLTHFLPSKRQRQVARMREYAAVHGLFVEFRELVGVSGVTERKGDVIYYGKRLPAARSQPLQPGTWLKTAEKWRSKGVRRPVPKPLLELRAPVLGASVDEVSCGVYWTESTNEDTVAAIRLALDRWHTELTDA
ncbi:MAG: hypothetical protein HRT77_12605 [Halioglobus sp.]|nr:hypothetical protein [Halioglobus sp.]